MSGFEIRPGLVGDFGNHRNMKVTEVTSDKVVIQDELGFVLHLHKNKFYEHFTIRGIHIWMYSGTLRFLEEFERQVPCGRLMTVEELKRWCQG